MKKTLIIILAVFSILISNPKDSLALYYLCSNGQGSYWEHLCDENGANCTLNMIGYGGNCCCSNYWIPLEIANNNPNDVKLPNEFIESMLQTLQPVTDANRIAPTQEMYDAIHSGNMEVVYVRPNKIGHKVVSLISRHLSLKSIENLRINPNPIKRKEVKFNFRSKIDQVVTVEVSVITQQQTFVQEQVSCDAGMNHRSIKLPDAFNGPCLFTLTYGNGSQAISRQIQVE